MFRVEHNVPDVYVNESRDFQLFARLYDLVFQASRFSIDSMENISDTIRCNDAILPLVATKVGFFTDLNLTDKSFRVIVAAFPYIIKYKGSLQGIKLISNVFSRLTNTSVSVDSSKIKQGEISIVFEDTPPDTSLLYSLLEYVRPTGLIIDYKVASKVTESSDMNSTDNVTFRVFDSFAMNSAENKYSGVVSRYSSNYAGFDDVAGHVGFTQLSQTERENIDAE